jgi:Fe2+ or Zn2+ uptake regulation protein
MELDDIEKKVLDSFEEGNIMTLKMITNRVRKTMPGISRQRVWGALQLLVARNLIKKVERGVYEKR